MEVARWSGTRRRPPVQGAGCLKVTGLRGGQRARHHGIFQASAPAGGVGQEGSLRARSGRSRGRAAPAPAGLPRVRVLDARPEGRAAGGLGLAAFGSRDIWRLEVRCRRRRLWCSVRGARTESVPFARPGSEFTRDFECLVAWLATRTDKSTIKRMLRIDWGTSAPTAGRTAGAARLTLPTHPSDSGRLRVSLGFGDLRPTPGSARHYLGGRARGRRGLV